MFFVPKPPFRKKSVNWIPRNGSRIENGSAQLSFHLEPNRIVFLATHCRFARGSRPLLFIKRHARGMCCLLWSSDHCILLPAIFIDIIHFKRLKGAFIYDIALHLSSHLPVYHPINPRPVRSYIWPAPSPNGAFHFCKRLRRSGFTESREQGSVVWPFQSASFGTAPGYVFQIFSSIFFDVGFVFNPRLASDTLFSITRSSKRGHSLPPLSISNLVGLNSPSHSCPRQVKKICFVYFPPILVLPLDNWMIFTLFWLFWVWGIFLLFHFRCHPLKPETYPRCGKKTPKRQMKYWNSCYKSYGNPRMSYSYPKPTQNPNPHVPPKDPCVDFLIPLPCPLAALPPVSVPSPAGGHGPRCSPFVAVVRCVGFRSQTFSIGL